MHTSRQIVLSWLLLTAVLNAGCAAPATAERPAGESSKTASSDAPQWPRPPAAARVRYLRSVGSGTDWGISKGFFGRMVDSLTGRRESHLVRPTGVTERAGVLYVADPGAQALFVFDTERRRVLTVTRLGDQVLASPIAVAPGPADTVFLVDSVLKQVFAVDRDGKLRRTVVAQGLARPAAVAYDAVHQRLYVADSMAHRILVFSPDGGALGSFGGNGLEDGQFNSPTHLALAGDGSLFVTDALNFRIQVFDPGGKFLRKFGQVGDGSGNFAAPKGVAVDRVGHIFVADALLDAVQIFSDDGQLLLGVGEQGMKAGQFWMPNGVFVNGDDVLYVADAYNQRVQVFQVLTPPAVAGEGS